MLTALKAAIGALVKYPKADEAGLQLTGFRSLKTAAVEPPLLELARAGRLFTAGTIAVAGARAPVQDVPTTTANWLLFNPASSPYCLVPLKVAAYLGSGTADTGAALIAGVTAQKLPDSAALTANAANHAVGSVRGGYSQGRAFLGVGVTVPTMAVTLTTFQWDVLASCQNAASTTPGTGVVGWTSGAAVVPPGFGYAIDVVSGAGTTAKFSVQVLFAALELDLD